MAETGDNASETGNTSALKSNRMEIQIKKIYLVNFKRNN